MRRKAPSPARHIPGRYRFLAAALFAAGLWSLTGDKPVHIDDPVFLWGAEQILRAPADPFGFTINWEGTELPASRYGAYQLPPFPLWPALLAAVLKTAGDVLPALHAVTVPFVVAALLSLASIAARVGAPAWLAASLLAAGPAFMVSATTLMPDVPCLALFLAGLAVALRSPASTGSRIAGTVLFVLAGYAKFTAVPALLAAAAGLALGGRHHRRAAPPLAIALLILLAWPAARHAWADPAGSFLRLECWEHAWSPSALVAKFAYGLTALALTAIHPGAWWLLVAARVRRHGAVPVLASAGAAGLFIAFLAAAGAWRAGCPPVWTVPPSSLALGWALAGLAGFCAWLGLVLAESVQAARRGPPPAARDPRPFLLCWTIGTLAGAVLGGPIVSVRYILLGIPAVLLLAGIDLAPWWSLKWGRAATVALLAGTLWLGSAATWADYRYANCVRGLILTAAEKLGEEGRRGWLTAHWGFQYYGARLGIGETEIPSAGPRAGDVVIIARNACRHPYALPPGLESRAWLTLVCPAPEVPVRLMHPASSAGFYASGWLPYSFSTEPMEILSLHRITRARGER